MGVASQVQVLYCNEPFWLAHHKKTVKLWRLLKKEVLFSKTSECVECLPRGIHVKREQRWESIWDKIVVLYLDHLEEPFGNLIGTPWEFDENSHWEQEKAKYGGLIWCKIHHQLIGWGELLLLYLLVAIFIQPRLMTGTYKSCQKLLDKHRAKGYSCMCQSWLHNIMF
jgi:hypothetical protein